MVSSVSNFIIFSPNVVYHVELHYCPFSEYSIVSVQGFIVTGAFFWWAILSYSCKTRSDYYVIY